MDKHSRITHYERAYMGDYGFEKVMVAARQRLIVDVLRQRGAKVVVEVGCGIEMLGGKVRQAGLPIAHWVIVEPGEHFYEAARSLDMGATRVDVIRGFFEESVDAVRERLDRPPDFIVCSGLLNEIEEPERVLRAARALVGPAGIVHVNVPNAGSLHRRLARAMGIIGSENELTERNRQLAQYRVYDFDSLIGLARSAGFRVIERGGYFLKPFTHAQMESLGGLLSDDMLDGFWKLGRELPDLASEIYVNLEAAE